MQRASRLTAAAALTAGAIAVTRRPWLYSGSTRAERRRDLPGDEIVTGSRLTATRATTIAAPLSQVWPWLLQMGHGRAGWYGYDLWDNAGVASAHHLMPELQRLRVGDVIPDAMGPFGFQVVRLDHGRCLVLRATIHPITGKPAEPGGPAPYLDFTWAFVIEPRAGQTRLLVRVRYDHSPSRWAAAAVDVYEVVDAVFTRRMLAGIRSRAEQPVRMAHNGAVRTQTAIVPGAANGAPSGATSSPAYAAGARSHPPLPAPAGGAAMDKQRRTRVAQIMTRHPVLLREHDTVELGGLTLLHHGVSAAPVVDEDDRLVGVFSHSDVLARFAAPRDRRGPIGRLDDRRAVAHTIGEACTRPPATISAGATVDNAARELLDRDIGRLIVVDHTGAVAGVVSRSDLLKLFLPEADDTAVIADQPPRSYMAPD